MMQTVQNLVELYLVAQYRVLRVWRNVRHNLLAFHLFIARLSFGFMDPPRNSLGLSKVDNEDDEDRLGVLPVQSLLERFVDNDRLDDRVWRSEMREVELWENERFKPAPQTGKCYFFAYGLVLLVSDLR